MNQLEIFQKIMQKKEFSKLPIKDIEMAFGHFEKRQVSEEEKIRLTRELLHKVFGAFTSEKLLSPKNKEPEWILRKHLSTKERLQYYKEVYTQILGGFKEATILDLGAGVNGFSFDYLKEISPKAKYVCIEAIGQLVDLANSYFDKEKLNAKAIHMSLFELERLKDLIKKTSGKKVVFLFKTLDSLEMLERDYSKKLLKEITPLADMVAVSFATRSMIKGQKFKAKRNWIIGFIGENFKILDDFELGEERYLLFER